MENRSLFYFLFSIFAFFQAQAEKAIENCSLFRKRSPFEHAHAARDVRPRVGGRLWVPDFNRPDDRQIPFPSNVNTEEEVTGDR